MYKPLLIIGVVLALIGLIAVVLWQDSEGKLQSNYIATPGADSSEIVGDTTNIPTRADSLISFAKSLMGSPYKFSGKSPDGFDCSGFTWYVFNHFNVDIPRTSRTQAKAGKEIPYTEARKGDLLIFTGSNSAIRHPGHTGIVVENRDGVISFIHSSSARRDSGVKISEVEGTNYKKRFLSVRRVLQKP